MTHTLVTQTEAILLKARVTKDHRFVLYYAKTHVCVLSPDLLDISKNPTTGNFMYTLLNFDE